MRAAAVCVPCHTSLCSVLPPTRELKGAVSVTLAPSHASTYRSATTLDLLPLSRWYFIGRAALKVHALAGSMAQHGAHAENSRVATRKLVLQGSVARSFTDIVTKEQSSCMIQRVSWTSGCNTPFASQLPSMRVMFVDPTKLALRSVYI